MGGKVIEIISFSAYFQNMQYAITELIMNFVQDSSSIKKSQQSKQVFQGNKSSLTTYLHNLKMQQYARGVCILNPEDTLAIPKLSLSKNEGDLGGSPQLSGKHVGLSTQQSGFASQTNRECENNALKAPLREPPCGTCKKDQASIKV